MLNRLENVVRSARVEDHRREEVVRNADDPRVARRRTRHARERKVKIEYAVSNVQAANNLVLATEDLAALAERDVKPGRVDLERIRLRIRNAIRGADRRRKRRRCLTVNQRPDLLGALHAVVIYCAADEEADVRRRDPVVAVAAVKVRLAHAPDIHRLKLTAAEAR